MKLKDLVICMLIFMISGPAAAGMLPKPEGRIILTISGAIQNTNGEGEAHFDRSMLERLDWRTFETFTYWTEGRQTFSGVSLRSVLEAVGAEADAAIRATALNDYAVKLNAKDAVDFDVMIALDHNGAPMRVRDKGPMWIIYPLDEGDVANAAHNEKMIWQLRQLHLE